MLFGSSGIRQKYSLDLVNIAQRTGTAISAKAETVIVGRDTRTTSDILCGALISGLLGSGSSVQFCGIVPTPTVAYGARNNSAGAMITASHNPEEYNGIKLFNPDGSAFTREQQEETEYQMKSEHWADWKSQGTYSPVDATMPHIAAILEQRKLARPVRAILDCGSGAGSMLSPDLLSRMGVSTTCLNCTPSGHFSRPSEPTAENLRYLGEVIRKRSADCAVVHDGDADRMMAFDKNGRYISGDHLLVLFSRYLGAKRVVTTFDASMAIDDAAEVRRTPVGDSYVSETLRSWGDFGGEPSGAWIFPRISFCPDGPYAAALLCEIASEWNLTEEIEKMPVYPIFRDSFPCDDAQEIMLSLGAESPTDGIREVTDEGWFLVRASGTEPKIRITAEGKSVSVAKQIMEKGRTLITRERKKRGS